MLTNSGAQEVKGSLFRSHGLSTLGPPQKAVGGLPQNPASGLPSAPGATHWQLSGCQSGVPGRGISPCRSAYRSQSPPRAAREGRFRVSNSTGSWTAVPHCPPPSEGGPGRSQRESLHQAPGMNPGMGQEETAGGAIDKSSKLSSGDEPAPLVVNNTQTWNTARRSQQVAREQGIKDCKGAGAAQGGFRTWPRGPGLL